MQVIARLPTGLQLLLNSYCKIYVSDPHPSTVLNSSCHKHVGLELRAFLQRTRMDPVFLKSHLHSDCEVFETQINGISAALIGYCLIGKEKQYLPDKTSYTIPNYELKAKYFIDSRGFDRPLLLFWEHTDPLIISVLSSNNSSGRQIALKDEISNQSSFIIVSVTLQIDVIKKALASKRAEKTTHLMKQNASTLERSNQVSVGSSPHPQRLRISGNKNTSESRLRINSNGRMISNSTLSSPNLATQHRGIYLPKSSVEDAESGTNLGKFGSLTLKDQDGVPQEKNPYEDTSFNNPTCSFSFSNQNLSQNLKLGINVRTVEGPTSKVHSKTSEWVLPEENTRSRKVISNDDLRLMGNTNDRRPRFTTEHGSFRLLKLSLEDAKRGRKYESPNLNVHTKTFEDVPRDEKKHCLKVALEDEPDVTCSKAFSDLDLNHFSRNACNSCYRGPLSKTMSRYRVPDRQSETRYWSRKSERIVSLDETSFRNKSLHINDYDQELRKHHTPSGTSYSKFSRGSDIDRRSLTVDARSSWREQQSKDPQPLVNVSGRVPLGVLPDGPAQLPTYDNVRREADFSVETFSSLKFSPRVSAVEFCASWVNNESTDAPEVAEQVATNSPLSSAQNITNELADGQCQFVLAAGSSKDLNNEAVQLSNGGMGCTEIIAEIDISHEQDSVPVRRVSRSLIEQLEALNIKARRIEAQKVAAQDGCDEKGKCTEVANGRDSSSGIRSYDAQSAKMKERAKQRANELQEEEEERRRTQKARALAKLEELNMRRNNREMPDQSKEQQVHHSYAKGSINKGNLIDACDQRGRNYCAQLSETTFSQSRRGIDIDSKLPMFDARSNRMPSGKPTVDALPGSMPARSRSRWIEKSSGEKAVGQTPRTRTVWVEKTITGRTAPILPLRTTKSVWIEKRRNM